VWYDFFTGAMVKSGPSGLTQNLYTPIDKINLHVRAGCTYQNHIIQLSDISTEEFF
jgi:alpha-glucosidase (family GH31 glycosyl hydrolase)